jgi:Phosphate-induced protein 1 conserved region
MKVRVTLAVVGGALLAVACSDTSNTITQPAAPAFLDVAQGPNHIHVMPTRAVALGLDQARPGGGKPKGGNTGIFYHGGPILAFTKVAAIYWGPGQIYIGGPAPGSSGTGGQDGSLVGHFLRNLGGSPYFNINTTYYDGNNVHVDNSVAYSGFWADNSNPGSKPTDAAIQAEVVKAFSNGLPYDAATVYLVFTGSGVNLGGGFGSQYCAYHGHFTSNGRDVKYAAEPYNYDFPSGCSALSGSPNGDLAADAEVNTLAHEIEEAATDPDLNAWYDRRGYENADKCAWTFGSTYHTSNGSTANMSLGGKDFLIQRNWVDAGSGGCALSY